MDVSIEAFTEAEQTKIKPTNIDDLLKSLLLANPELMKDMSSSASISVTTPTKRITKAPSADYYLTIINGCECCHAISTIAYHMKWDGSSNCFRQNLVREVSRDCEEKTQKQTVISRTCLKCLAVFDTWDKGELIGYIMKSTDPESIILREAKLKTALRRYRDAL